MRKQKLRKITDLRGCAANEWCRQGHVELGVRNHQGGWEGLTWASFQQEGSPGMSVVGNTRDKRAKRCEKPFCFSLIPGKFPEHQALPKPSSIKPLPPEYWCPLMLHLCLLGA